MDIVKIDSLPREITLMIITKSTPISRFVCKNVNKKWYKIIREEYKKNSDKYIYTLWPAFIYFNAAAYKGFINILKWLKNERQVTSHTLKIIIEQNQLESLKYLNELENINNQRPLDLNIEKHNFETIKWLHNNNFKWIQSDYNCCIINDCFEILQFLIINKRPQDNINFMSLSILCETQGRPEIDEWLKPYIKQENTIYYQTIKMMPNLEF